MASRRYRRFMQEALDRGLSPEAEQELQAHLERDREDASLYQDLRRVDRLLRSAPLERAPHRLALRIMARLAEDLEPLSRLSGLALALGLALMTLVVLPVCVLVAWLLLSAVGNAQALSVAIQGAVGLVALVVAVMEVVVQRAQALLVAHPELPLMLALIPLTLGWLWYYGRRAQHHTSLEPQEAD